MILTTKPACKQYFPSVSGCSFLDICCQPSLLYEVISRAMHELEKSNSITDYHLRAHGYSHDDSFVLDVNYGKAMQDCERGSEQCSSCTPDLSIATLLNVRQPKEGDTCDLQSIKNKELLVLEVEKRTRVWIDAKARYLLLSFS